MKQFLLLLFVACVSASSLPPIPFADDNPIAVQNSILANVNGQLISVLDVKKKMDVAFHQHYSHLENSSQARLQFYQNSWEHVLNEMIDHELILADAEEKKIPLSDGEIREEMELRFGPNLMTTLDTLGLSYEEAAKMVKDDLIVQRMTWWFIHAKAMKQVTPQEIRQAFRIYLKEHPPYEEWNYQVISLKGDQSEELGKKLSAALKETGVGPEAALDLIKGMDPSSQVSSLLSAKDIDLSESHREILSSLETGTYSDPVTQKSRSTQQVVTRIFYLQEKNSHPAPEFESLSQTLRSQLMQKAVAEESTSYLEKLRRQYTYTKNIPERFTPFSQR